MVTTERKDACNRAKAVPTGIPLTGKNADCWPVCQREVRGVRFYQMLFVFPFHHAETRTDTEELAQ